MLVIAALTLLVSLVAAQSDGSLTVTFAPDSLGTCATSSNSTGLAVTLNTFGVPQNDSLHKSGCFNLNETFSSQGPQGEFPSWTIQNGANFDPSANYSRVWYEQVNTTGKVKEGKVATQFLQLYPVHGCVEAADYITYPIYGYSCQSGTDGQCDTAAYSVKSFSIRPIADSIGYGQKCFDFRNEENPRSAAPILNARTWTIFSALFVSVVFVAA